MRWGALLPFALVLACGTSREDWPAGSPRIDDVNFIEQTPQDPNRLVFDLAFTDTDGDLAGGMLFLSLNGREASTLAVADVFASQAPAIEPTATEGTFDVFVTVAGTVSAGDELDVGFRLEDAGQRASNEPVITLQAIKKASE